MKHALKTVRAATNGTLATACCHAIVRPEGTPLSVLLVHWSCCPTCAAAAAPGYECNMRCRAGHYAILALQPGCWLLGPSSRQPLRTPRPYTAVQPYHVQCTVPPDRSISADPAIQQICEQHYRSGPRPIFIPNGMFTPIIIPELSLKTAHSCTSRLTGLRHSCVSHACDEHAPSTP